MKSVVMTSFDENYYPYAHVTVRSFSDNYFGNEKQDFICLVPEHLLHLEKEFTNKVGNVSNLNIKFACAPDYTQFIKDSDQITVEGEGSFWWTRHALHRIFMIQVLDGYDKAIYLDPDTLVVRDIKPLMEYPMYNKFLACVEVHDEINHLTNSKDDIYFADGVFVADLNFWRESGMHEKMKEFVYNNTIPTFLDQDVFNIFFMPYLQPLPLRFNTYPLYSEDKFLAAHTKDPLIMHYAAWNKPWKDIPGNEHIDLWRDAYNRLKA